MELLVEGFRETGSIRDESGAFKDISKWEGLRHDESGELSVIKWWGNWHPYANHGTIDMQWVPASVKKIEVNCTCLESSVTLTGFANGLEVISIQNNALSGALDLTHLPASLVELHLNNNQFSGKVDVTRLPNSLEEIGLRYNRLTGEIKPRRDMAEGDGTEQANSLPHSLMWADFGGNAFSGGVDLTALPRSLISLPLNHNEFTGSLDLTQLSSSHGVLWKSQQRKNIEPRRHVVEDEAIGQAVSLAPSLKFVNLSYNKFSGSIDITALPSSLTTLRLDSNQLTGSLDLSRLPSSMEKLHFQENHFSGTVRLNALPSSLKEISLYLNDFSDAVDLKIWRRSGLQTGSEVNRWTDLQIDRKHIPEGTRVEDEADGVVYTYG